MTPYLSLVSLGTRVVGLLTLDLDLSWGFGLGLISFGIGIWMLEDSSDSNWTTQKRFMTILFPTLLCLSFASFLDRQGIRMMGLTAYGFRVQIGVLVWSLVFHFNQTLFPFLPQMPYIPSTTSTKGTNYFSTYPKHLTSLPLPLLVLLSAIISLGAYSLFSQASHLIYPLWLIPIRRSGSWLDLIWDEISNWKSMRGTNKWEKEEGNGKPFQFNLIQKQSTWKSNLKKSLAIGWMILGSLLVVL